MYNFIILLIGQKPVFRGALKKFRGKGLVIKIEGSIKYTLTEMGIKTIAAILCMLINEMPALTSVVNSLWKERQKNQLLEMDNHLLAIHQECINIKKLNEVDIAA